MCWILGKSFGYVMQYGYLRGIYLYLYACIFRYVQVGKNCCKYIIEPRSLFDSSVQVLVLVPSSYAQQDVYAKI